MAEIFEKPESRAGTHAIDQSSSRTLLFGVFGTDDEDEVVQLVMQTVPAFYNGLKIQNFTRKTMGGGCWDIDVNYGTKDPRAPQICFDTSGGTFKRMQSLATRRRYTEDGDDKIDFGGCINVNDKGQVEGVEVVIPKFSFQLTRFVPSPMDPDFRRALFKTTGRTNSTRVEFQVDGDDYVFRRGELLYKGCRGSKRGGEDNEIVMLFDGELNRGDDFFDETLGQEQGDPQETGEGEEVITVQGFSEEISKRGFEYLWFKYEDGVDNDAHVMIPHIRQATVEQVYEEADLSPLFTGMELEKTTSLDEFDEDDDSGGGGGSFDSGGGGGSF